MRNQAIDDKTEHRRSRVALSAFGLALAALGMMFILAGPGVRTTEAADLGPNIGQRNVMADYNPGCSQFATVPAYTDVYGNPVYQPMQFYGDPNAFYQQCITPSYANCNFGYGSTYGYGYNPYNNYNPYMSNGVCSYSCPGASTLYINGAQICIGPPAQLLFAPSPTAATCGGASNLEVAVLDSNGFRVLNGTEVNFTTTLGYVSATEGTQNGLADTSLTIPSKQAGSALVTATAGGISAQKLVQVTC